MSPLVGLTLVSVLFGVAMLVVLKYTSNQEKLDAVKRKIHAGLFEIRLFNDDLRSILRAQWDILRHNVSYLWLWMVPLLVMMVPLLLMLGQLHFHYGYRGLQPGEQTLFTVELTQDHGSKPAVQLEVPDGLRIDAGPVWIPNLRELSWRLEAEEWGDYQVAFEIDGERFEKNIQVAENIARRSPVRPASTPRTWGTTRSSRTRISTAMAQARASRRQATCGRRGARTSPPARTRRRRPTSARRAACRDALSPDRPRGGRRA